MNKIIEICAATLQSAVVAQRSGADRIELCSELGCGGVTPSAGVVSVVRRALSIPINLLIRPRSGDFVYSSYEAESVLEDISFCAKAGINGVVIGALTHDSKVDEDICREWLKEAHKKGLSATFHRAIDCAWDIMEALEKVNTMGYDRVLTSGGHPTAYEGIEVIRDMVRVSGEKGAVIMAGSGVNPENIREIATVTGVSEIHLSASSCYPSQVTVTGGIGTKDTIKHSDPQTIARAIKALG